MGMEEAGYGWPAEYIRYTYGKLILSLHFDIFLAISNHCGPFKSFDVYKMYCLFPFSILKAIVKTLACIQKCLALSPQQFPKAIEMISGFSRIFPYNKLEILPIHHQNHKYTLKNSILN